MKIKNKKKKLGAVILIAILAHLFLNHSDQYVRDRVVQLVGNGRSCSGEQVKAPSGESYILTAGHCSILASNGAVEVITEGGAHLVRKIIAEDQNSDLLLLEGLPHVEGLAIANSSYYREPVRTFTHGKALKTYETDGVLIQDIEKEIQVGIGDTCPQIPKYRTADSIFGQACLLVVTETATTAMIQPGSSGGPVVDSGGQLIGVCSAGGDGFGWLVRLSDIKAFLAGY